MDTFMCAQCISGARGKGSCEEQACPLTRILAWAPDGLIFLGLESLLRKWLRSATASEPATLPPERLSPTSNPE